jgi:hypothetical protein
MNYATTLFAVTLLAQTETRAPMPPIRAYADCIAAKAVALIPSGEPAETLVKAAAPSCEYMLQAVLDEFATELASDPIIAKYGKQRGYDAAQEAQKAAPRFRVMAQEFALAKVVQVKANKAKK